IRDHVREFESSAALLKRSLVAGAQDREKLPGSLFAEDLRIASDVDVQVYRLRLVLDDRVIRILGRQGGLHLVDAGAQAIVVVLIYAGQVVAHFIGRVIERTWFLLILLVLAGAEVFQQVVLAALNGNRLRALAFLGASLDLGVLHIEVGLFFQRSHDQG